MVRKRWCIKDTRQLVHKNKNEVEHAWGFNRAEEVLDIVDYLAGLTNYPNLTVSIWLLESGSWVKYVAMKSGSAKKFKHRRIGLGLFFHFS